MVFPYFILSIGAGAILESKANFNIINDWVGKGKRSILFRKCTWRIFTRLCLCNNANGGGLLRRGATTWNHHGIYDDIPLLAPQTIILTYALLGGKFTFWRVTFAFIGGIGIGLIIYFLENKQHD